VRHSLREHDWKALLLSSWYTDDSLDSAHRLPETTFTNDGLRCLVCSEILAVAFRKWCVRQRNQDLWGPDTAMFQCGQITDISVCIKEARDGRVRILKCCSVSKKNFSRKRLAPKDYMPRAKKIITCFAKQRIQTVMAWKVLNASSL